MSADNVTTMLSVTKQLEDIYVSQRVEDLDKLTSGKVTLHKDSITLGADIQGIDNLKKYYQVRRIVAFLTAQHHHKLLCGDSQDQTVFAGLLQKIQLQA